MKPARVEERQGRLTRDKFVLSRANPKLRPVDDDRAAKLDAAVARYVDASVSDNTRRAYTADVRRFAKWGGRIPTTDKVIAAYIAKHADRHRVAMIVRWLAAISKAHQTLAGPNPTRSGLVKATIAGIKRVHGTGQRQAGFSPIRLRTRSIRASVQDQRRHSA